jgi:hypothetical protein
MSKLRVNTVVNRTNTDKVIFPYGIGVTNGIIVSGIVTATSFVGSGVSLTGVQGTLQIQDSSGNTALTGITTIRVGVGLTVTNHTAGIASIRPTGYLENLTVVGLSTFGTSGLTTINSNGQLRSQALGNLIPQSVTNISSITTDLYQNYRGALVNTLNDGQVYRLGSNHPELMVKSNHSGIITSSGGFDAISTTGFGFRGPLFDLGISTTTSLHTTNIRISAGATVGTSLSVTEDVIITRNLLVSGISTLSYLVSSGISGNLNSSGVSTISQLVTDSINCTGIVTASSFSGNFSGNITGILNGEVASSGLSTLGRLNVGSINSSAGVSTIQQLKGDTISITGVATATSFSGSLNGNASTASLASGLSGVPNIIVGVVTSNTILPSSDNSFDLGSSGVRWANIYSADMHFSNEGSSNSVDGTWGSWTLQEGENNLYMLNNRTGKKYKINLTEV